MLQATRSLLLTVTTTLALAFPTTAQVSQVKNTGCPNAAYPTMTNPKIGQTVTFNFPKMPANYIPVLVLGYMSGNPIKFNKPFTCANGCAFYPAPLLIARLAPTTTSVKLPIPNDIRLWRTCYSMQTAAFTPNGCFDMHGALSFCIGR